MTSTDQSQIVENGSQAIQAGRDVIIHPTMSSEQMAEIMVAMARQLSIYQADAMQTVETRLSGFREELLKKFVTPGQANPESFRDPDFQYLLGEAQEAYARSGDDSVRNTLIDLIAKRSLQSERNRLAITLNDAVTKTPLLTINEFSALSLVYLVRYTVRNGIVNFPLFLQYVATQLMPFVPNISRSNASFWHLEAQSCASIEMSTLSLLQAFKHNYGGLIGRGFDRPSLESLLPEGRKNIFDPYLCPCLHDPTKLQPSATNKMTFTQGVQPTGAKNEEIDNIWNLFENSIPSQSGLVALLQPAIPNVADLFDLWDSTPLKQLKLNSVGIAIGHANAVRVVGFDAPLNTWID